MSRTQSRLQELILRYLEGFGLAYAAFTLVWAASLYVPVRVFSSWSEPMLPALWDSCATLVTAAILVSVFEPSVIRVVLTSIAALALARWNQGMLATEIALVSMGVALVLGTGAAVRSALKVFSRTSAMRRLGASAAAFVCAAPLIALLAYSIGLVSVEPESPALWVVALLVAPLPASVMASLALPVNPPPAKGAGSSRPKACG